MGSSGELQNADGQKISFLRRKGTKNDLLNPNDNSALPSDTFDPFLGGWTLLVSNGSGESITKSSSRAEKS
jgi:hypothetical protein